MINRDSFVPKLLYDKEKYIVLATHGPGTISYDVVDNLWHDCARIHSKYYSISNYL